MADEELELELDVETPKSKKTMIIVIVAIVLLNAIGLGTWLFLSGDDSSGAEEKDDTSQLPLFYQTLTPEFVVNFGPGSKVRYLQVDIQIATRDQSALAVVATYKPVIRNDILVLLSDVSFEDLNTRAGKETLQRKIVNTINRIVFEATHAAPTEDKKPESHEQNKDDSAHGEQSADGAKTQTAVEEMAEASVEKMVEGPIENVYFASFIMQ